jgi:hypothetical protein
MSVEGTKDCPLERPFAAAPGNVKVGVEVVLEGTTAREVPVNPFYASLHTADGTVRTVTLAGCEPGLHAIRIVRGQRARGFVTFEVRAHPLKSDEAGRVTSPREPAPTLRGERSRPSRAHCLA